MIMPHDSIRLGDQAAQRMAIFTECDHINLYRCPAPQYFLEKEHTKGPRRASIKLNEQIQHLLNSAHNPVASIMVR
jgi:hypothetical protein